MQKYNFYKLITNFVCYFLLNIRVKLSSQCHHFVVLNHETMFFQRLKSHVESCQQLLASQRTAQKMGHKTLQFFRWYTHLLLHDVSHGIGEFLNGYLLDAPSLKTPMSFIGNAIGSGSEDGGHSYLGILLAVE